MKLELEVRGIDDKSDPDNPTRLMVDVKFERELRRFISLDELKVQPGLVGISPAAQG